MVLSGVRLGEVRVCLQTAHVGPAPAEPVVNLLVGQPGGQDLTGLTELCSGARHGVPEPLGNDRER